MLLILALLNPPDTDAVLKDRVEWKAYQARVTAATSLRVTWEEDWTERHGDEPQHQVFKLSFVAPDHVRLEFEGQRVRILNGKQGAELDLRKKTFHLTPTPNFNNAFFLGIAAIPQNREPDLGGLDVLRGYEQYRKIDVVHLRHQLPFFHAPQYCWRFDRRTGDLVGFTQESSYRLVGSATDWIQEYAINPKLDPALFSIEPPAGFTRLRGANPISGRASVQAETALPPRRGDRR